MKKLGCASVKNPCFIAAPYQGAQNVLHSACTNFYNIKMKKLGYASVKKRTKSFVLHSACTNFVICKRNVWI